MHPTTLPAWAIQAITTPCEVLQAQQSATPADKLAQAEAACMLSQYTLAAQLLSDLNINQHPHDLTPLFYSLLLSRIRLVEGNVEEAIQVFNDVLSHSESTSLHSFFYCQWASALEALGSIGDALRYYTRALELLTPTDSIISTLIHCGIARVQLAIGDAKSAHKTCSTILTSETPLEPWANHFLQVHLAQAEIACNNAKAALSRIEQLGVPMNNASCIHLTLVQECVLLRAYVEAELWDQAKDFGSTLVEQTEQYNVPYLSALARSNYGMLFSNERSPYYSPPLAIEQFTIALSLLAQTSNTLLAVAIHKELSALYRAIRHYPKAYYHLSKVVESDHRSIVTSHEIKQYENAITTLQLKRHIDQLNSTITQLKKQLEQADQTCEHYKQQLQEQISSLGVVAHDLKNPIAAILMSASLIERYGSKLKPSDWEKQARTIIQTAEQMRELVMSLLDYAALSTGKLRITFEPVHCTLLFDTILESYRSRALSKSLTLHRCYETSEIYVIADSERLSECLDNLLSNAIKYTPLGRNIYCSIEIIEDRVRFSVRDEGIGLTKEQQDKLFQEFTRIHTHTVNGEDGTGLGLSIVRRLIEAMNGSFGCTSTPGQGSTFYIELSRVSSPNSNSVQSETAKRTVVVH